jgi:hypothetical protein
MTTPLTTSRTGSETVSSTTSYEPRAEGRRP